MPRSTSIHSGGRATVRCLPYRYRQIFLEKITMDQTNILPIIKPTEIKGIFSNVWHTERLLAQDMKGNPTYIGQTLKKVTDILNENNIEFALAGALSLGIRCRPRYTVDIDLLVHPDDYKKLEKLFKKHGLLILMNDEQTLSKVNFYVIKSMGDPEFCKRSNI